METIIAAALSAGVTLIVCLINNHYQHSKTIALVTYRLDELTKQVEKHNQIVERTYRLEEAQKVMEERIKVGNHRLDDLERRQG